jgi:hypothetical protein
VELFERIGCFFKRLERYIDAQQTSTMGEILVKAMVEVLSILAIATKQINQSGTSTLIRGGGPFFSTHRPLGALLKRLVGRTDIEDALRRLDKLTQEEACMATAESLKATHGIHIKVEDVGSKVRDVDNRVKDIGNKIIDGAHITFDHSPMPSPNVSYD